MSGDSSKGTVSPGKVWRLLRPYMIMELAPDGRSLYGVTTPHRFWTRAGAERYAKRLRRQHEQANRAMGHLIFKFRVLRRVSVKPLSNPTRGTWRYLETP